ncbi:MAG: hypothetical protein R2730_05810 [Chitinophagales bacterium]
MGVNKQPNPFDNFFNLEENDITTLQIKQNSAKDNCYLESINGVIYGGFILIVKQNVKTICKTLFYKSKTSNKFITRLEFRKVDNQGIPKKPNKEDVIIKFTDGKEVANFWQMINFLQGFNHLVDLGDFESKYKAVSFDNY